MQLMIESGSLSIRRTPHMRSLWIEYPRANAGKDILAVLFDRLETTKKFRLPVLHADQKGIEIKLPSILTGMFYLKIEDGEQSFLRQIAIQ
jgi:hypothetical protein